MGVAGGKKHAEQLDRIALNLDKIVEAGVIPSPSIEVPSKPVPSLPPEPIPSEPEVIACTIEDILGKEAAQALKRQTEVVPEPTPIPPVPTEPEMIACTFEDIFGCTEEEYMERYGK